MSPSIPTHVVVVASWFPAVDETSRGRFVADQVQALAAGGRVRPAVISFDSIGLTGSPEARFDEAAAIASLTSAAIRRDGRLFSRSAASGPAGLPVARVAIAGSGSGIPSTYPVTQRERVLETLDDAVRGAEIVHAHTGFPDGAASAGFAERLGVPLVITEHASFIATILSDPDRRAAYLRGMTAARRVVAVSGMLGRELTEMIPAVADKVMVIPNAVDVEAFTPQPLTARHPDELVYVGYRIEFEGNAAPAPHLRRRPSPAAVRDAAPDRGIEGRRRGTALARSRPKPRRE